MTSGWTDARIGQRDALKKLDMKEEVFVINCLLLTYVKLNPLSRTVEMKRIPESKG